MQFLTITDFSYYKGNYDSNNALCQKKMRSVSHPATHHLVFQLNLRSHIYGPKFFLAGCTNHSLLKLLTGLAIAAFMAWKLTVARAISKAANPDNINDQGLMLTR